MIQLDVLSDSLVVIVNSYNPDLNLNQGPCSYQRLVTPQIFEELKEILPHNTVQIVQKDYLININAVHKRSSIASSTWGYWRYGSDTRDTEGNIEKVGNYIKIGPGYFDEWGCADWAFYEVPEFQNLNSVKVTICGQRGDTFGSSSRLTMRKYDWSWINWEVSLPNDYGEHSYYVLSSYFSQIIMDYNGKDTVMPIVHSEDNYYVYWVEVEITYTCNPPSTPSNVNASDGSYCDFVRITWSDVSNETGYKVYRGSALIADLPANVTSFDDTGASPGQTYSYKVYAYNGCGTSGPGGNSGMRGSPPDTPGNVNASDGSYCDFVRITWSDVSNNTGYKVYRGSTLIADKLPPNQTYYDDTGASPGQNYTYKVYAYNGCGISEPGSDSGRRGSPPVTPGNVNASDGTYSDRVYITWSDVSNETGYKVYRGSTLIATKSANVTSHDDYDANPGQTYTYNVYAYNDCNESSPGSDEGYIQGKGTINGNVSTSTGNAVPGVKITLSPGGKYDITDEKGTYSITDIDYGEYIITPSLDNHIFDPSSRPRTLSANNPNATADFTDISVFTVSGHVKYNNTNCPVEGVHIFVDGNDTSPETVTGQNGSFQVNVLIGNHTFKPQYGNHTFNPPDSTKYIDSDITGFNFKDTKTFTLSGKVTGGCNHPVGVANITITSSPSCYTKIIQTDTLGAYSVDLPPLVYLVDAEVPSNPLIQFETQTVDLRNENKTCNFIYNSPLEIEFSGFPDIQGNCEVPIMKQGESYLITINVFERYGENTCPVENGELTIYDNIGDNVETTTLQFEDGTATYTIAASEPDIVSPHKKHFEVEASSGKRTASHDQWVIVTGHKPREQTFTTVSPELPLVILRDPPGDESYSFLSESTTMSVTTSMGFQLEGSVGVFAKAKIGAKFAGVGVQGSTGTSIEVGGGIINQEEIEVSFSTETIFKTSDLEEIIGSPGDVFGGAAINLIYAITDVLEIDDNCQPIISQNIAWKGDGFETFYLYTKEHIENVLIPELQNTGKTDALELWQRILDLNEELKKEGEFIINRSFSAGAETDYSETTTLSQSKSIEFYIFINGEVAAEADLDVFGSGGEAGVKVRASLNIGASQKTTIVQTNSVGYSLRDNDTGDIFSVDIYDDKVFGSPVFNLVSGRSSCPWEPSTVPRDGVEITIDPHERNDVPADEAAIFTLYLKNTSQTDEERTYWLSVVEESNPNGAVIKIGGATIEDHKTYSIPASQQIQATLTVERGPEAYNYDDLQVELYSPCDRVQFSDIATFSVHFIPPCSNVSIYSPDDNWVVNKYSNNNLEVTLTDFDIGNENLERLKLEYSPINDGNWYPDGSFEKEDIQENYVTIPWDVSQLEDGEYEIRAAAKCSNGVNYSDVITGTIDRHPPEVFGIPEPADGILSVGDEISIIFTEEIEFDSVSVKCINKDDNTEIDIETNYSDKKIIITPVDKASIEDHVLEITISNIADIYGNELDEPESWSFYVGEKKLCEPHFTLDISNTGNNAIVLVTTENTPLINGESIDFCDEIAIFTPRGLCSGLGIWDGNNLSITVWGDDPDESGVLGFQSGESFLFKIWDSSEETEYYALATYLQGDGTYATDKILILSSLNISSNGSVIHLDVGWNMISTNIIPDDPTMETIFADIVDDVIIVKNGKGQVYWPSFVINQIGDWVITDGYKVKMIAAADLVITGTVSQQDDTIYNLEKGWSLISFVGPDGMSPSDSFAQIVNYIVIVKNGTGQVYWPEFGIDQIKALNIGEGYKIKLSSGVSFKYPSSISKIYVASVSAADPRHFVPVSNTGYNATIAVSTDTAPVIGETPLITGDEIGVITSGGLCVGAVVWENENTAIPVWGDDPDTDDTIEGIKAGEEYIFKIWSAATETEYDATATYSLGSSIYAPDAIVVLESLVGEDIPTPSNDSQAPRVFVLYQNCPNPFNPDTTIEYEIPENCLVKLTIYNLLGQEVKTIVNEEKGAGRYSIIWDGTDNNGGNVTSGVYIYKIMADNFSQTKKLMLMR